MALAAADVASKMVGLGMAVRGRLNHAAAEQLYVNAMRMSQASAAGP